MTTQRSREIEPDRPERKTGQFRPQELEKYPERREYKEVPQNRKLEAQFKEKTESKRVLGLPRVDGFEKSEVMLNREVSDYLKKEFPERHVNNISMETVRYNDKFVEKKRDVELAHWEKKELGRGTEVFDKEIVINRQTHEGNTNKESMKGAVAHEVGHQVHNMYLEKGDQKEWLKISGDRPKEKCVSEYARTDHAEDFAESYKTYVRAPETLKATSQEKYNFMRDQVFGGREYTVETRELRE